MSDQTSDGPGVDVVDDTDGSAYRATIDGDRAGVLSYVRSDGVIDLQHTAVPDEFGGKGVGSALIRFALDEARRSGERVVPTCPFVQSYLDKHPDQRDLLADR